MADLAGELRAEPPAAIAALSAADQATLAEAIRAERKRQAAELEEAVEKGLAVLPRVLRAVVRKALL